MRTKYLQKHNFRAMSNDLLIPWGCAPQIWISFIDNRRTMNLIFPLSISFVSWVTKMDSSHLHFGLLLTLCMHKQQPVGRRVKKTHIALKTVFMCRPVWFWGNTSYNKKRFSAHFLPLTWMQLNLKKTQWMKMRIVYLYFSSFP